MICDFCGHKDIEHDFRGLCGHIDCECTRFKISDEDYDLRELEGAWADYGLDEEDHILYDDPEEEI